MSFYSPSGSRCVSPTVNAVRFDTAHRKKASPNIFENINWGVLVELFEKAGDTKAIERAKVILTHNQDPECISKALLTLQTDKRDRFMLITGLTRQSFTLRLGVQMRRCAHWERGRARTSRHWRLMFWCWTCGGFIHLNPAVLCEHTERSDPTVGGEMPSGVLMLFLNLENIWNRLKQCMRLSRDVEIAYQWCNHEIVLGSNSVDYLIFQTVLW